MLKTSSRPPFARFLVLLLICSFLAPSPVIGQDEALQPMITDDLPAIDSTLAIGQVVLVAGWAVDPNARGTGVDQVHIYVDGLAGGGGTGLGAATYGASRPDVADAFGRPAWASSGFNFVWTVAGFEPGPHTFYIYAHSMGDTGWWYVTRTFTVVPSSGVQGQGVIKIEAPVSPATITGTRNVTGYAADCAAGTPASRVRIFDGAAETGTLLGSATMGASPKSLATICSSTASGHVDAGFTFNLSTARLGEGDHTITAVADVTGGTVTATLSVIVANSPMPDQCSNGVIQLDQSAVGTGSVQLTGYTLDRSTSSGSGTGVTSISLADTSVSTSGAITVNSTSAPRSDASALYGSNFTNSGFTATWNIQGTTTGVGATRTIRVDATGRCGTFSRYFTVSVGIAIQPPTNLTVGTAAGTSVTLTWAASPTTNVTSYRVYQSTSAGGGFAVVQTVAAPSTTVTLTNLASGATLYFYVTATNQANQESTATNTVNATISGAQAPVLQSASTTPGLEATNANLSWSLSPSPGVTGYNIYRATGASGAFSLHMSIGNVGSAAVGGLAPNSTNTFYVVPIDASSREGAPSARLSVTTAQLAISQITVTKNPGTGACSAPTPGGGCIVRFTWNTNGVVTSTVMWGHGAPGSGFMSNTPGSVLGNLTTVDVTFPNVGPGATSFHWQPTVTASGTTFNGPDAAITIP